MLSIIPPHSKKSSNDIIFPFFDIPSHILSNRKIKSFVTQLTEHFRERGYGSALNSIADASTTQASSKVLETGDRLHINTTNNEHASSAARSGDGKSWHIGKTHLLYPTREQTLTASPSIERTQDKGLRSSQLRIRSTSYSTRGHK